jgi:hypothetical protein
MNKNQFSELWNDDLPNQANLLKLENEDIDELPSALIQNIQNKILIQKIYKQIHKIERYFFYPQTLTLLNCEELQVIPGKHWTSKIYTLFRIIQISPKYIHDIYKNENDDDHPFPNTIYIQLISFQVKMFVLSALTHYFSFQPNSCIKIYD